MAEFGRLHEIHDCCHCSSHTAGHSILSVNGNHCVHHVCLPGTAAEVRQSHLERLVYYTGRRPQGKVAEVLQGPSDAHAKISTKTCPSSQHAIICMAETQQMSVTQGCGDKPKLQTQSSLKTFTGESPKCSSASGNSITPAEGEVICVHGLVTGSNVCNHIAGVASLALVL